MKKGQKIQYKPWEGLLMDGVVEPEKASMQEATNVPGRGGRPSPAIVSIVERVVKMKVEEPLKYAFPNEQIANNFRSALATYIVMAKFTDMIHVGRSGSNVFVYRKA